jgi:hypothetical protein
VNGERPRLEDFLTDAVDREVLLAELIAIELFQRHRLGERPTFEEYRERFPDLPAEGLDLDSVSAGETVNLSDATQTLPAGTGDPYFGKYRLVEEIEKGGMGVVWKAWQTSPPRFVALKMIRSGEFASVEEVRRFHAEAEAAGTMDHPHIVPIYEVGEHDGQHYFSMKLMKGGSLKARLGEVGLTPGLARSELDARQKAIARLMITVARAVHHAHQRGILHRDLKPANVLLDEEGRPHVTDFGLAKRIDEDAGQTLPGQVLGTPSYMAPEQARGDRTITTQADVYGLGSVLYVLLTGQPPFQAGTVPETLRQVQDQDPVWPRAVVPHGDRDLETICLKCLEKDPARRYNSAEAVAEELERWQRGEPILARPVGQLERTAKWVRRNPAVSALTAAVVLVLMAGILASAYFALEADAGRRDAQKRADAEADARKDERKAREDADRAKELAEQNERDALRNLYRARLFPMVQAWKDRDFGLLEQRLEDSMPEPGKLDFRGWEWYYFLAQCRQVRTVLPGSGPYGSTGAWCRQTRHLAAATEAGAVDIWDMTQDKREVTLPTQGSQILSMAWDPTGKHLACASPDEKVRIWDVSSHRVVRTLPGAPAGYQVLAWSPDGKYLAFGRPNGTILIWKVDEWDVHHEFPNLNPGTKSVFYVFDLDWHPDSVRLASSHRFGYYAVWDISTKRRLFFRHCISSSYVNCVRWNPDGSRLATGAISGDDTPNIIV